MSFSLSSLNLQVNSCVINAFFLVLIFFYVFVWSCWQSVFKVATMLFKWKCPAYLQNLITFTECNSVRRWLRSSTTRSAVTVRTRTKLGSFAVFPFLDLLCETVYHLNFDSSTAIIHFCWWLKSHCFNERLINSFTDCFNAPLFLSIHRTSQLLPSLSIFCCHLKSHLFSLSYPAFWLFSHLYSARAVTRHFGRYNRYHITRTFSCAGPSAWNSLPSFLRDETLSLNSFKRYLKCFLFATYWHSAWAH